MPDMGLTEILTLIGTAVTAGTAGYGIYEQRQAQDQQVEAQRRAQQQAQQQALATRRQQTLAEGPTLQSQVSGSLTPQAQQAMAAELTGNPGIVSGGVGGGGAGSGGGLTPAIENLFPSGGVPSLTEPWPTNV